MNRKLLKLSENEKNSILEMHKSATRNHYLTEQEDSTVSNDENKGTEDTTQDAETTQAAETFDCSKLEEYLQDADVKKWIENMKGPKKWLVQKGTHNYDERAGYEGAKKIIAAIQCKLELEPDGLFGNDTKTKVEAFQVANGLTKDGKVGKNTIAKLFGTESEAGTEAETGTESESNNQNECYKSFGVPITDGNNMAGYEVEEQRQIEKDGKIFIFGFKSDGKGNLNKSRAGGQTTNPFKWSCENGELKMWQEQELEF